MAGEKTGINWVWVAGGAVAVAAAVAGGMRYRSMTQTPVAAVVPAPVENPVTAVAQPAVQPPAPAVADPEIPAFDTVRVEPDGSALVAGRGPAGATLRVMVDGAEAATGTVDGGGKFAALFDLPASDAPRLMTLEAVMPDGTAVGSTDSVAVAPTVAPVVVAVAQTAADPVAATPPEAPATLLVTDEGASVIQAPVAVTESGQLVAVSIDTISYAPDGAVQLSGQGAAGAFVRLYLDNTELLTVTAPANGPWSATLPEVAPGIYTLRADQIGADGKVASRFETPFKRETPQALAAAVAVADVGVANTQAAPAVPLAVEAASETVAVEDAPVATPVPAEAVGELTPAPAPALEPTPADPAVVTVVEQSAAKPVAPITMTVQPGFSLWKIARESYGDGVMYVQVFDANRDKIKDPDLIYPGQVFTMPAMQ